MGILLGLLTALTWGGAISLRVLPRIASARFVHAVHATDRFLLLSSVLPWLGGWGHLADGSGWQTVGLGYSRWILNAVSGLAL